ncbi:hypothetical protein AgCh_013049 [Apium graveolens]
MADKRRQGVALGYGEYLEIYVEKEFISVVKASDRVVYQFYRENWPFKLEKESCANDVALSEEQVNQMLREWQSELNHPSPASLDTKQDERMEKGRKKGGFIALVAELDKEKEMKVEVVESTSKVCESKGKGLVAENEDHLS